MKLTAKGRTKDIIVAKELMSAFFEYFNVDSYIRFKEGAIELEMVFEEKKLPIKVIEALGNCDEIEFVCGQPSESDIKTKTENKK